MSITSLTRRNFLLVFRDASIHRQKPVLPAELGTILCQWLEWHDQLETQGKLRFRCPVEERSRSVSKPLGTPINQPRCEQHEPVIGYLLVDARNFEEATEIARGCPGLAHGFRVEIYPSYERCNEGNH